VPRLHHKTLGHPKAGEQPSVWALHEHFYRPAVGPNSLKRCRVAMQSLRGFARSQVSSKNHLHSLLWEPLRLLDF
jgi:hypothetical protein